MKKMKKTNLLFLITMSICIVITTTSCSSNKKYENISSNNIDSIAKFDTTVNNSHSDNVSNSSEYSWLLGEWVDNFDNPTLRIKILDSKNIIIGGGNKAKYSCSNDTLYIDSGDEVIISYLLNSVDKTIIISGYGVSPDIILSKISDSKGVFKEENVPTLTINNSVVKLSFYAERKNGKFVNYSSNIFSNQNDGQYELKFFLKKQFVPNKKCWIYKGFKIFLIGENNSSTQVSKPLPGNIFVNGNTVSCLFESDGNVRNYSDGELFAGTGKLEIDGGDAFQFNFSYYGKSGKVKGEIYFEER